MKRTIRLALVGWLLGLAAAKARGQIRVVSDKENVVASRLEGDWQLEPALTKRLTDTDWKGFFDDAVSFQSDPRVSAKIPARFAQALEKTKVYLAGIMTFKRGKPREHVFVLIEHHGNPHVVWFRERQGDPLGDAESFNVFLAVANDRQNDLLFIGGDFNNQPFRAYARVPAKKKK